MLFALEWIRVQLEAVFDFTEGFLGWLSVDSISAFLTHSLPLMILYIAAALLLLLLGYRLHRLVSALIGGAVLGYFGWHLGAWINPTIILGSIMWTMIMSLLGFFSFYFMFKHQFFQMFPDQETARRYLESRRWPDSVKCTRCSLSDRITVRKNGYYRCNHCKEDFTVRTNTIFERSHVPLHKWIYAMYLLVTVRKGISSVQLSKEIGITQKSAWFVLQRLHEACDMASIAL